jgi:hypothetical protein
MPTAVAIQCVVEMTPKVPRISGRVVKSDMLCFPNQGGEGVERLAQPLAQKSEADNQDRNPWSLGIWGSPGPEKLRRSAPDLSVPVYRPQIYH